MNGRDRGQPKKPHIARETDTESDDADSDNGSDAVNPRRKGSVKAYRAFAVNQPPSEHWDVAGPTRRPFSDHESISYVTVQGTLRSADGPDVTQRPYLDLLP
jgi:hypothetical protein